MDYIDSAYDHLLKESLLTQIKSSLAIDYDKARRAHDSTHEFMLLASEIVINSENYSFKTNLAYFIYHWEIFDQFQRSNLESLCTFYNSAFVLLRTILELLIKGTFFDCLSHKKFRNNSLILDNDKQGNKLKRFLNEVIKISPEIENDLEENSAIIYDKLESYLQKNRNQLTTKTMLRQIVAWGIFDGIECPELLLYTIYKKLSSDVHVSIDNTDIGRRLLTDRELFKNRPIMPEYLAEYLELLHMISDISIVSLLNVLQSPIINSEKTKIFLKSRLSNNDFLSLKLKNTENRIRSLITNSD